MITTKKYYRKGLNEVNEIIKYIYPDRPTQTHSVRKIYYESIIHRNVSSYAQALVIFHDASPFRELSFNKNLKV